MCITIMRPAIYSLGESLGRYVKLSEQAQVFGMSPMKFWLKYLSQIRPDRSMLVFFPVKKRWLYIVSPSEPVQFGFQISNFGALTEAEVEECYIPSNWDEVTGIPSILLRRSELGMQLPNNKRRFVQIYFLNELISVQMMVSAADILNIPVISADELKLFVAGIRPDGVSIGDGNIKVHMGSSVVGWVPRGHQYDSSDRWV